MLINPHKPALFNFANCTSFLVTISSPIGAALYVTLDGVSFSKKQPNLILPKDCQLISTGVLVEAGYVNTSAGYLKREDVQMSVKPEFENTLIALKNLAMDEEWSYTYTPSTKAYPILFNYLIHTFAKIQEENKISFYNKNACFNTGLVTDNQEEIFMLFRKKKNGSMVFHDFCKESSNELLKFGSLPERASYFNNASDLIYDLNTELRINIDHIVNDTENFSRFPEQIKLLHKHQLINTFQGAVEHAKKRIKRNYLTAVPQYYRGYVADGQLQLLLPLCLIEPSKADLALAVYKNEGVYSGRTCLTLDMAINNARLITKPDDEWLRP